MYNIGDRVTLLLGKDGAVAGIAGAKISENTYICGIVTAVGKKQYTDKDGKRYAHDLYRRRRHIHL